jgi:hypothetical protein
MPDDARPSGPGRGKRLVSALALILLGLVLAELAVLVVFRPALPEAAEGGAGARPAAGAPAPAAAEPGTPATDGAAAAADSGTAVAAADSGDAPADSTLPDARAGRERAGLGFKDPYMVLHPYLGYVFRPRKDASGDAPSRIAVSEDGFLDDAPAVRRRREGVFLVGLMGGSVAGQMGSFHSAHLRDALRGLPAVAGREVELVRLGMPGYHQPQQLLQLGYLLAQGLELDLLINLDGFNELAVPCALNAPSGAHPLFPMNWSMVALDVPDPEIRRHVGAIAWLKEERARRNERFASSLRRFSPTARLLRSLDDRKLEADIAAMAWELQRYPAGEIPFFVRGPERDHVAAEAMIPACVDVWRRSSLQMQAICAASGIRYLHALQPNQYDPGSKPLSPAEVKDAFDPEGPYRPVVEEGYPLLRAAGRELADAGVAFHDLSAAFAEVDETLYVDSCCHFNGEGNRILAEAIGAAARVSF